MLVEPDALDVSLNVKLGVGDGDRVAPWLAVALGLGELGCVTDALTELDSVELRVELCEGVDTGLADALELLVPASLAVGDKVGAGLIETVALRVDELLADRAPLAVDVTEDVADPLTVTVPLPVAAPLGDAVGLDEPEADAVVVTVGVATADVVPEAVPVIEPLGDLLDVTLGDSLMLEVPLRVAGCVCDDCWERVQLDVGERVALGVTPCVRVGLPVAVGVLDPLAVSVCDAVGGTELDCDPVGVPERVGDTLGVTLDELLVVPVGVSVRVPLAVQLKVDETVSDADGVPDALVVAACVRVPLPDADGRPLRVPEKLAVWLLDTVAAALPVFEPLGVPKLDAVEVTVGVPLRDGDPDDVPDRDGRCVPEGVLDAVGAPLGVQESDCVPESRPVGDPEELGVPLALLVADPDAVAIPVRVTLLLEVRI